MLSTEPGFSLTRGWLRGVLYVVAGGIVVYPLVIWAKHMLSKESSNPEEASKWDLKSIFFDICDAKTLSRVIGHFGSVDIPQQMRTFILSRFAAMVGCDLSETEYDDLSQYPSLSAFFHRKLKPGLRPVDTSVPLVSPCDGIIFSHGRIEDKDTMFAVKGVKFSLAKFVPESLENLLPLNRTPGTNLFYAVIYLAPYHYHWFHSPAEWNVNFFQYVPGRLRRVNMTTVSSVPELYSNNERVVLHGRWPHGHMLMAPVGATNVGSINILFLEMLDFTKRNTIEEGQVLLTARGVAKAMLGIAAGSFTLEETSLKTNRFANSLQQSMMERPVSLLAGDSVGYFNFGSTVVLLFEAPAGFNFLVEDHQSVKCGQALGRLVVSVVD